MNEQEARAIEAQLNGFIPGCKAETYETANPNYDTRQFDSTWRVSVDFGSQLICVIRTKEHFNALLSMCVSYYNLRKETEEDAYTASHTCKNCLRVFNSLYDGLCENCDEASDVKYEHF